MPSKPYNDLKLRPDQMVSPQDQATNNFKDSMNADQQLSDNLAGRQTAGKKKRHRGGGKASNTKYSKKKTVYNKIRNPESNRYVNIDSTQGRRILRNYLENYSNIKS